MSKAFLSINFVLLFALSVFAKNAADTVEVLRIYNLVGAYDSPVTVRFPDSLQIIKVDVSYKLKKGKHSNYPTKSFCSYEDNKVRKFRSCENKESSNIIILAQPKSGNIFEIKVQKPKDNYTFNWEGLINIKKKNKDDLWYLKEIVFYAKSGHEWFHPKDSLAPYPKLTIENMLVAYKEKGGFFGLIKKDIEFGIEPTIFIRDYQSATTFTVTPPLELMQCGILGLTYVGGPSQEAKAIGKPMALQDIDGKKTVQLIFYNKASRFKQALCSPRLEIVFAVPNKPKLPDPIIELKENQIISNTNKLDSIKEVLYNNFKIETKKIKPELTTEDSTKAWAYINSMIKNESSLLKEDSTSKFSIYINEFILIEKKVKNCPCGFEGGDAEVKFIAPILRTGIRKLGGIIKIENQKFVLKDTFQEIKVDTLKEFEIELLYKEYKKKLDTEIIKNKTDNTVLLSHLSAGIYYLNFYSENPSTKTYTIRTHTEPFIIQKGADNCPRKWMVSTISPIQKICLSVIEKEDSNLPCRSLEGEIVLKENDHFVIIGLNEDSLAKIDPSSILKFKHTGHLVRERHEQTKLKCDKCKEYENYTINSTIEFPVEILKDKTIKQLDSIVIGNATEKDPIIYGPFKENRFNIFKDSINMLGKKINEAKVKYTTIKILKVEKDTSTSARLTQPLLIDLKNGKDKKILLKLIESNKYDQVNVYYRTFQVKTIE